MVLSKAQETLRTNQPHNSCASVVYGFKRGVNSHAGAKSFDVASAVADLCLKHAVGTKDTACESFKHIAAANVTNNCPSTHTNPGGV
ncbi:hypothetical protein SAMN05421877_103161 [Sphingobacterium lactis]|uniref:Uncharacterized protein n=1 Tax=Sphingobacterium lactis TaxID=797291 RepID=A0A1H5VLW2_9SPHI|nr:hypothetical protein SAMN05421877_103161 [Sphingobacterium lactis]